MWIENRREINTYEEVMNFIKNNNEFHDMRIGSLDYDSTEKTAKIFIEEVDSSKKVSENDVLYQYYFELKEVEKFIFHSDLALTTYVLETYEDDNKDITLALTNGEITFNAKQIILSVPDEQK